MFDKAKKLWDLRKKAQELQKELRSMRITETAIDGKVEVTVTGEQKIEEVKIDDSLMTPSEKEVLIRGFKQAASGALSRVQQEVAAKMKDLTGGDLSGLLG